MNRLIALLSVLVAAADMFAAADWPQFHGPGRDNISTETGLLPQWPEGGPRSASTACADGRLYLMNEKGVVALAAVNPQRMEIISRFELPKQGTGPSWAHPVVCNGRLYVRYSQYLYVYDIRK